MSEFETYSFEPRKKERMLATGEIVSDNVYNLIIGIFIALGFIINFAMAYLFPQTIMGLPMAAAIGIYIAGAIISMFLVRNQNPATAAVGFFILSISLGILLTFILNEYELSSVYMAFLGTTAIAAVMMFLSTLFPRFFIGIGRWLVVSLIAVIIIDIIGALFFRNALMPMDYIVVAIFGLFIGYDWAKAQAYPKTVSNAIASAADLYLDLVNILIRLLEIFGTRKD